MSIRLKIHSKIQQLRTFKESKSKGSLVEGSRGHALHESQSSNDVRVQVSIRLKIHLKIQQLRTFKESKSEGSLVRSLERLVSRFHVPNAAVSGGSAAVPQAP